MAVAPRRALGSTNRAAHAWPRMVSPRMAGQRSRPALYATAVTAAGERISPLRTAFAWGVHLYTALGAVLGFVALDAVFRSNYRLAFTMLAVALLIDSSDGALARKVRVKHVIPWIDGELLDNIVDYFTYVIVPAAIFMQPGILPQGTHYAALAVLLASAYGFCRTDAKGIIDHYFRGFPSYWNVMAFYFVVLRSAPALNLAVVFIAVVFVFVPMRWLYPSRMESLRGLTIGLGIIWGAMSVVLIAALPEPSPMLGWISLFYPLYYVVGSVVYHFRNA
jgi:phosphatidylcholine synthase